MKSLRKLIKSGRMVAIKLAGPMAVILCFSSVTWAQDNTFKVQSKDSSTNTAKPQDEGWRLKQIIIRVENSPEWELYTVASFASKTKSFSDVKAFVIDKGHLSSWLKETKLLKCKDGCRILFAADMNVEFKTIEHVLEMAMRSGFKEIDFRAGLSPDSDTDLSSYLVRSQN